MNGIYYIMMLVLYIYIYPKVPLMMQPKRVDRMPKYQIFWIKVGIDDNF